VNPQQHYELAESLLASQNSALNDEQDQARRAAAQVHATLALAGFTRDAHTGADHVHGFICGDRAERDTEPGRSV
jgi:hypothetical protein